jgi:D-alanyl-D-alanine carboxypeptidase
MALAMAYSGAPSDFVAKMNEIVSSLNLKNSIFENPSGLDGKTNNYSSCYDLAYLTSIALENETFRKIFGTKTYDVTLPSGKKMHFFNKHKLVISDNNVIGGKTGYTKKAGRTLITVFNQNGRELVVVTMDAYNDWNLHRSLVNAYDE